MPLMGLSPVLPGQADRQELRWEAGHLGLVPLEALTRSLT